MSVHLYLINVVTHISTEKSLVTHSTKKSFVNCSWADKWREATKKDDPSYLWDSVSNAVARFKYKNINKNIPSIYDSFNVYILNKAYLLRMKNGHLSQGSKSTCLKENHKPFKLFLSNDNIFRIIQSSKMTTLKCLKLDMWMYVYVDVWVCIYIDLKSHSISE